MASGLRIAIGLQGYLESRAQGASILCYHGVVNRYCEPALEGYCIDAATLSSHLKFLRRKYEPVPLSQMVAALRDRMPIPNRWIAVSLDDALESQVTLGAEILAGHKIPWSLAVPAGLIGTRRSIWSYELSLLLLKCWEDPTLPDPADESARLPMQSFQDRAAALARVRKILFGPTAGSLALRYLDALLGQFGPQRFYQRLDEYGGYRLASWDQLRQLHNHGVELLAHGWHHLPHNAGLTDMEIHREIVESRQLLTQMTGAAPQGFVFPHGILRPDSCSAIEAAGYVFGLTSQAGGVLNSSGCYDLPRYNGEHSLSILRRYLLTARKLPVPPRLVPNDAAASNAESASS